MEPSTIGGGPTRGSKPTMGVQPTARTSFCWGTDHRGLTFQQSQGFSRPARMLFHPAAISKICSRGILKYFQSPVPALHSAKGSISFSCTLFLTKRARSMAQAGSFELHRNVGLRPLSLPGFAERP